MKYICSMCGYIYDETAQNVNVGDTQDTKQEHISRHKVCPRCKESTMKFYPQQFDLNAQENTNDLNQAYVAVENVEAHENMHKMSFAELSALCSNLAKSCERQYLFEEAQLFSTLADYYKSNTLPQPDGSVDKLLDLMEWDLAENYVNADNAAQIANDRGSKRILRWSKNVTRISDAILSRYKFQGEEFLKNSSVYICEICGYIYIGDTLPPVCPVCRVANFRIVKVE